MTQTGRITRTEVALLMTDPYPVILLIVMPLVLIAFLSDALTGGPGQSVPGLMILFAFLGLYNVGMVFFRDHGWGTWDRLRTLPLPTWKLVAGKTLPLSALYTLQSAVLLGAGYWLFDMPMRGSVPALAVVVVVVVGTITAIGLALISFCRTMNQVTAVTNLGGIVASGLGGALAPVESLPTWVQHLAPISPVYWALAALRGVVDEGKDLLDLARPITVLMLMAAAALVAAIMRFHVGDAKEYYA